MPDPETNPIDPDVDLHVPAERAELHPSPWPVLAAVSAGGVLGTLGRYALMVAFPHDPGGFPWATFVVNGTGCLLIGVLMVVVTEVRPQRRLARPFFGVGVLGGFTTFSTYVLDIPQTLAAGAAAMAVLYLAATLLVGLGAVWAGVTVTARVLAAR